MYSVFLSSYTNTRESLGELEKAVETAFLVLPNFHSLIIIFFIIFICDSPRTCTPSDIKSLTYNQSPSRLMKLL